MTAFDTDLLSLILINHPVYTGRMLATVPVPDRYVPVVSAGEVLRGRLAAIRSAEAGRGPITLEQAYWRFEQSVRGLSDFKLLPYTPAAEAEFVALRARRIRIGSNDLRIAAICLAHAVTLATRNAQDFRQAPGLKLDVWP